MIIHHSPYPDITPLLPDVTLPVFLFGPSGLPTEAQLGPDPDLIAKSDLNRPLFCPPPALDPNASSKWSDLPPELKDLPPPSRPAAEPLSLSQLRQRAELFALGLQTQGWGKGDVLSVVSENQHDYPAAILGAHLLGITTALHNPSYTKRELTGQFELVSTKGVLASLKAESKCQEALDEYQRARNETPASIWVFDEPAEGKVGASSGSGTSLPLSYYSVFPSDQNAEAIESLWMNHAQTVKPDQDAVYCFSSGTSGKPKAVRLSHANLVANVIQATSEMRDRTHQPLLERWSKQSAKAGQEDDGDGVPDGWYNEPSAETMTEHVGPEANKPNLSSEESKDGRNAKKPTLILKLAKTLNITKKKQKTDDEGKFAPISYDRREVHIDILPQFHCYGLVVAFVAMHTNTPRFVLPRFSLPLFLHLVTQHKITFSFIVPPILLALCRSPLVDHPSIDISSLTRLASGAASLPTKLRKEIWEKHHIKVTNGYGMSEMSPIISLQMVRDLDTSPDSVGILCAGTQARVIDVATGQDVTPSEDPDEPLPIGELWLRGPQRMSGYLNNPEANQSTFVNSDGDAQDWLRTGDVVSITSSGYIKIHDRTKDVIKIHGFQVSPTELEEVLISAKEIHDVAVIGIKQQKESGEEEEIPWAFCVPAERSVQEWEKDQQGTNEVLKEVNEHLARYKHIRGITWLSELPKSDSGKVLKKELKRPQ
ncbi:unnamed protein product [Sympodiomycopsis kandeliae]